MGKFTPRQRTGGTAVHVRDCRVWAEINYLDSPTDYREYLPAKSRRREETNGSSGGSDDSRRPRRAGSYFVFLLVCLFLLAIGLMLHLSGQ